MPKSIIGKFWSIIESGLAVIVRYAVYHGIVNAVSQFSNDFPENSLKESTIRGWKKTYSKELSSRKKAGRYDGLKSAMQRCVEASRLQTAKVFPT